jgi:O-antigen/teichoic acid export membrane protein
MLLITPIFINKLGASQFGIWMLVNSVTQMMSIFNMGLGDANIRYISKYQSQQDYTEIKSIVSTTFGLSIVVGLFGIIIGIVVSYLIEERNWFNVAYQNKAVITACVRLSFLLFSLKFIEIIILSIFQGFERYDLGAQYSLLSKSVILISNLAWVLMGAHLTVLFLSSAAFQLLFVVLQMTAVKNRYRYLTFKPLFKRSKIRKVLHFSVWTWLQSVMAIGTGQADKFIVAYFSGVQTLSYYSIGYMLMGQLHAVFSTAISWIFPVVSKKFTTGLSMKTLLKNAQAIFLTFGFGILITLLFVQKPVFTLWLGNETYQNSSRYITLFIYYNLALLINIIPYYFLNGSGYAKFNTYSELISRTINISGMILLFNFIGNDGLVWGHIVAMLISAPIKTSLVQKFVVKEKATVIGIDSFVCCLLIIAFFESENLTLRIIWVAVFIWTFYSLYIKSANISKLVKWI